MKFCRFLPALIWMGVIFYFSSVSTAGIGTDETFRFTFFKSLHLLEYAMLGILLFVGIRKVNVTIATAYVYAISDEIHQYFIPGRHCKFSDTLIDLAGMIIGLIFVVIIRKKLPIKFTI
jgi:VanZ family protein